MKKQIVEEMREKQNLSAAEAEKAFDAVAKALPSAIRRHGSARIPGLGTFKIKHRDQRTGRNPATGESITIAARDVLTFKASEGAI